MHAATMDESGNGAPGDPTLAVLVPKPSRRRNVVLVVLAVVLLFAVAFAPKVLRPSVADGSDGSATSDQSSRIIVTAMEVTGESQPWLEIDAIDDVLGADVEGAWLVPEEVVGDHSQRMPEESGDPQALVAAQFPGVRLTEYVLPRRLSSGERAILAIAWRVTDCPTLDHRNRIAVQARSVIGWRSTMTVPMFDGGLASLARDGICPKRPRNRR